MINEIYRSGFVQRYAQNPEMAWIGQTDAHHQWGVTILMFALFGDGMDAVMTEMNEALSA